MKTGHIVVLVAVAVTLLLLGEVRCQQRRRGGGGGGGGSQAMPECQRQFQTGLLNCASTASINVPNFLWVATNRSMGQAPSDMATFRTALCGNAQSLLQCGETFIGQLLNSSACQPTGGTQDLRPVVDAEFGFAAFNVRQFCGLPEPVPPCQQSFENSLVSCAGSSSLNDQNFLWAASNQSRGQAPSDVTAFRTQTCGSLTTVLQCIQTAQPQLLASSVCQPGPNGQDFRPMLNTEFTFVTIALQLFCGLQPNVTQQPPEVPPCQQNFESNLLSCAVNNSLNAQNFLWVASRQSRGQAPADQTAFRTAVCSARAQLRTCGEAFMSQLFSAPQCQASQDVQDFRPIIQSEYQFVILSLEQYCGGQPGQRGGNRNV